MSSKTSYEGIDYSMGMPMEDGRLPNIDIDSRIRYGVIHQNAVIDMWADWSEPEYSCAYCDYKMGDRDCVTNCDCEPVAWHFDKEGYLASQDSSGDIFVMRSPYFTYAQFCSPCAPGACHLENPLDHKNDNNRAYCFGHDWFSDRAPYDVFDVETGKLVPPPNKKF